MFKEKRDLFIEKFKNGNLKDALSVLLLILPYAILFSLFIAIPTALAITLSLSYFNVIEFPEYAGLLNYITVITQDSVFLRYVLPNTLKYALIVGPGGYILSFMLAWMLAQIQKGPRTILSLAIYAPSMVGGIFTGVVWKTLFNGNEHGYINALLMQWGLIDRPVQFLQSPEYLMPIMIIVALWSSMGIGFLAMVAGILNANEELYEAAYIDGIKNKFQEVMYITIPSMKPQMLFGAVMAIVGTFNSGGIGVALSGSNPTPQNSGQLIINHIEDYGFQRYEMGYAAALSVILLLIIWGFSKIAYKLFAEKN
ncbi:MAG: transporter, permease component [Haloplasmataceae bacterium]|jgi:multiple sugar transport system permease protein|nr:transporter, permease component [Haloplasmataceae bacterium]